MSRSVYNLIKSGGILKAALAQLVEAGFTRIEASDRRVVLHGVKALDDREPEVVWYETRTKVMLQDDEDWIDPEEQPGLYSVDHHPRVEGTFVRWMTPWDIGSHGPWIGPFTSPERDQRAEEAAALTHARGEYE